MGGLAGWWLGVDDGYTLEPTLTPREWHAALRATGFGGVDTMTLNTILSLCASNTSAAASKNLAETSLYIRFRRREYTAAVSYGRGCEGFDDQILDFDHTANVIGVMAPNVDISSKWLSCPIAAGDTGPHGHSGLAERQHGTKLRVHAYSTDGSRHMQTLEKESRALHGQTVS
ncbi:hypothetical protein F5B18DRAFT_87440 [Nemania serpens]|nr:hypothetical protein F5B18DRAFT_87440 [Nemania serpens]